ncbi:NAD(P)/FAD-dependent oxidoreductase [Vogesella sp. LIG4]|uniref:NAD(P)-binding protein n=1 Tax=Vogesella sp. LIG4 TaxID=1192162 RepID=UPI00081F7BFF|nr:NAD(P)/FAD-dependent oxidoreductase [Vogesella sp. LIG4]SCK12732.1 NAD(P)-binding Rossmann-like domain-containing protein [Vogesella sp. LIG4]
MRRRDFLQRAAMLAGLPLATACQRILSFGLPLEVSRPGMAQGHRLRDAQVLPSPRATRQTGVVIVGSGAAGLFAAWRLRRAGFNDFVVLNGPEPDGNAAGGRFDSWAYPTGAHYLPLPSRESVHVRELLAEMGVIEDAPFSERPRFDERVLVHAPDERLWRDGQWQYGLMPQGMGRDEAAQQQRFLLHVEQLRQQHGRDGRRVFAVPLVLSSQDPQWRKLDCSSFAQWLAANGYTAPGLLWYLDYCCRDDYGSGLAHTSAWAGLHYFAARDGHAANAEDGAVLTWPDGLSAVMRYMRRRIGGEALLDGAAWRIQRQGRWQQVDYLDAGGSQRLLARQVIIATPLHVAWHLLPEMAAMGFAREHLPPRAPWLVGNVLLQRFPREPANQSLAWDNVVFGSRSLGYVVSTNQLIGVAKPERTVFTCYHAFADGDVAATRQNLRTLGDEALFDIASRDIYTVYGSRLRRDMLAARLTVRAHAMASPSPGFLGNAGLSALRAADDGVLFAHSDLSGLSLFEEACWWGEQAAHKVLARG